MTKYYFSAYALTKEFELNSIAKYFNIEKKYKWEDSLVLNNQHLEDILGTLKNSKFVHIYSFGSIVLINFSDEEMTSFIKFLESNFNTSINPFTLKYTDEYELKISDAEPHSISNDYAICPVDKVGDIDIISLVLARSAALDKLENGISKVIDEVEDIIEVLEKGKLNLNDKDLAKMAARIFGFRYTSISYIMLLDKPDITWEDIDIDDFYYELAELFELEDRYNGAKKKLEFLTDMTEVFSSLTYERRSTRLEWMIIVLIAVEILLYLFEMFYK